MRPTGPQTTRPIASVSPQDVEKSAPVYLRMMKKRRVPTDQRAFGDFLVITHKFERRLFDTVSFHRRERRENEKSPSLRALHSPEQDCTGRPLR